MKDKPVILVVDDQFQNIELLEAYLVPQGYEIVKASSGQEAFEKISKNQIDLILLDVMMPGISGIEVLEKLRADEKLKAIPVVMVTVLKETEDKLKALEAGCDDFISKPFDKIELLARVKSILKINYYIKQLGEKDKFKEVVDKISDGIAICRHDYTIKDSNPAFLKYLNISDPANVNLFETLFTNFSVSISKEALTDLAIAHKTFDVMRQKSETAEALYLEANMDLIKNSAGELLSIIFILRDVTATREEEFLKQDTLTLLSHKLRTPLGVINGNVSLLQDGSYGPLNEEQRKVIDSVSKQSSLLISIVEELLGFTIAGGHSS
ncbi:MAG: response regulator [Candidatus Omnitrophica bacterium]|nr:response regulator [Candidatus Omnitrophota bacterium]